MIYWKFKYSRTQRALAVGVSAVKNGKIVFDLTLIYGCKTNRYVVAEIVDGALDIKSVKAITSLDGSIKKISQEYFLNNQYLVENSHLTNSDKYYILHCLE